MQVYSAPTLTAGLLVLALFGCAPKAVELPKLQVVPFVDQPVPDAPACIKPPEMAAFNMAATKVRLYVLARNCGMIDQYNEFVTKNRTQFPPHEKALSGYFARTIKRGAVAAKDEYDTGLANALSQRYAYDVASACAAAPSDFALAAAAKTTAELNTAAETLAISQPMKLSVCK